MIELSFKQLNDNAFHVGLIKLAKYQGFAPKQAYQVNRIVSQIGTKTQEARTVYNKIVDKYAKKNEKGLPILIQNPPFFEFKEGVSKEEFEKEYAEFLDIKVEIDKWNKLPLSALPQDIGLSAMDLQAIDALIEFDLEEETNNVIPIKPV